MAGESEESRSMSDNERMDIMWGSDDDIERIRTPTEGACLPPYLRDECYAIHFKDMLSLYEQTPDVDMWNGWDFAALLESERRKVRVLGKKRVSGTSSTPKKRDKRMSAEKALRIGLWSAAIGNETIRRKKENIVEAVAGLTLRGITYMEWNGWKVLLSPDDYKIVWQSVFDSVAKFVLSIFDVEDFWRIYHACKIDEQQEKLCSKLKVEGPLLAVVGLNKLTEEDFCFLWEQDVGLIYQGGWDFIVHQEDKFCVGDIKQHVLGVMEKFVPLKEDHKMQLTLEFAHRRSYHVFDALLLEVWKGVEIKRLAQCIGALQEDKLSFALKRHPVGTEASQMPDLELEEFVDGLTFGLESLAVQKNSSKSVVTALSSDDFGKIAEEVMKVVLIADHKRRIEGRRFISLKHIMFGLSLCGVGEAVEKILNDRGLNKFTEKPPKMPIYFIYTLAREAANSLGEEVVQLEHLALAIIYVKLENDISKKNAADKWANLTRDHLESLKKANTTGDSVTSLEVDIIAKDLPKDCYLGRRVKLDGLLDSVKGHIKAFDEGWIFPAIRA